MGSKAWRWTAGAALVALLAGPPGARSDPGVDLDAAAAPDPDAAAAPAPACAESAAGAADRVRTVFAQLREAWTDTLPGPTGEAMRERETRRLAKGLVDVEAFAAAVLRDPWQDASGARQRMWRRAFAAVLEQRYLHRLGDPTRASLEVGDATLDCDHVRLGARLVPSDGGRPARLEFRFVWREGTWRAYDVAVDGVSLASTWRSRFSRIYQDGGLRALDRQLEELWLRYTDPEEVRRVRAEEEALARALALADADADGDDDAADPDDDAGPMPLPAPPPVTRRPGGR